MARAPKKDKFHSEAPEEIYDLLDELIEANHKDLDSTEFLILMKHGGWKSKGKTVLGKVKVLGDDFRRVMYKDVVIYLNADMWGIFSKPQRKYILDEQLFSLDTATDRHGCVKEAKDGRPLLTTVPPDIQAYNEIVKRHGLIMEDVKRLAKAMTECNQLTLEEVLKFENNENAAAEFRDKVDKADPPHEGVKGTINPDGTADLTDQSKLDMDKEIESLKSGEDGNGQADPPLALEE